MVQDSDVVTVEY